MCIVPFCSTHQLVTQPGSPTENIWEEELMPQQGAVLKLVIYTVCDVNLLQFGPSGILQVYVHIPMSQYWFPTEILSHQPKMKWLIETALASLTLLYTLKA